jgi:coniferyl-aldehyde dehydrogenase
VGSTEIINIESSFLTKDTCMTTTPEKAKHSSDSETLLAILEKQRKAHFNDGSVSLEKRRDRLNRLIALTCENADAIADAIGEDYGGARSRHTTLATEVVAKIHGMEYARDHLEEWTKPESREPNELPRKAGATSFVLYQPKGVVGLISPWNMPYGLTVSPLTSVLAAGNRAMIKLSEFTPILGVLMQRLVRDYFSEDEIAVILGGPDVGRAFAQLPFDH